MASQFENRLVGISILVASVVIFLPTIIDGKKMAYEDEFVATPIHPELKTHRQQFTTVTEQVEETQTQQQDDSDVALQNDQEWQVEEVNTSLNVQEPTPTPVTKTVQVVESKPVVKVEKSLTNRAEKVVAQRDTTTKAVPQSAWTIQLGAFQNASNINALLKTLHKAGFQAHTVPAQVIDGELTRLFVGPDVSKEKLEKQLPRLKRLTKLEGKLYPFDAVNP